MVIGSQQQIPQKGLITANLFYNFTPQGTLLSGTNGVIPSVDTDRRQLILGEHREIRTITQTATLDINYGLTDRFGIEVAIPYASKKHQHVDGLGETNGGAGDLTQFYGSGIGDVKVALKYNVLPTLRSMIVAGIDVYLPTGNWAQNSAVAGGGAGRMEPTMQIGRGNAGLGGSFYQTYELIPHRLNEFAFGSYRHTFRNNFGYQFGDQYDIAVGANLVTVPWLVLTSQINYRYMVHDTFSSSLAVAQQPGNPDFPGEPTVLDPTIKNRPVPTTGSTYLAYTPGFQISLRDTTSLYFYSQIPLVRDFNGNLAQGVSYVFGLTQYFQGPTLF
ncbi:MAG: hypothetical protein KGN30_06970 [Nitrospirota bacterium]|nr:hypothetical protein [Nitrospirota bacterium]